MDFYLKKMVLNCEIQNTKSKPCASSLFKIEVIIVPFSKITNFVKRTFKFFLLEIRSYA